MIIDIAYRGQLPVRMDINLNQLDKLQHPEDVVELLKRMAAWKRPGVEFAIDKDQVRAFVEAWFAHKISASAATDAEVEQMKAIDHPSVTAIVDWWAKRGVRGDG